MPISNQIAFCQPHTITVYVKKIIKLLKNTFQILIAAHLLRIFSKR